MQSSFQRLRIKLLWISLTFSFISFNCPCLGVYLWRQDDQFCVMEYMFYGFSSIPIRLTYLSIIFIKRIILGVWVFPECMSEYQAYALCMWRLEESIESSRTGLTDDCEAPCGFRKSSQCSLPWNHVSSPSFAFLIAYRYQFIIFP